MTIYPQLTVSCMGISAVDEERNSFPQEYSVEINGMSDSQIIRKNMQDFPKFEKKRLHKE